MLQFITHHTDRYDEIAGTRAVLEGGCRWVQLRMKDTPAEEVLRIGREIEKLCREYGAKFILDDHVELVRELNADGVHLGKLDMPVAEARRLLGPEYLIGATANTFEDIERGAGQGADYIGLGPFRFTQTKRNLSPVLGLEGRAVENAADAKKAWLEAALEEGIEIHEPGSLEEYSGQFKIRMPRSLHRDLAEHSKKEGISMNQYCIYLLSKNDALLVK